MYMPGVESASDALVVLQGADPVIDIFMPGMSEAMFNMSMEPRKPLWQIFSLYLLLMCSVVKTIGVLQKEEVE
jgi:hypothetical protein